MNSEDFNKCREFLESLIPNNLDNKDLLDIYRKLIELKSEHDKATQKAIIEKEIKEAELNEKYYSAVNTNNTDYQKEVFRSNTQYNMNAQNNWAATQQNYDNQRFGAFNNAVNNWPSIPGGV